MPEARRLRMTLPTQLVLRAMLDTPAREVYGLEVARLAELAPGTVQPILARLEVAGWAAARWESGDPAVLGRPVRRYFLLTAYGRDQALRALESVRTPAAVLARLHARPER